MRQNPLVWRGKFKPVKISNRQILLFAKNKSVYKVVRKSSRYDTMIKWINIFGSTRRLGTERHRDVTPPTPAFLAFPKTRDRFATKQGHYQGTDNQRVFIFKGNLNPMSMQSAVVKRYFFYFLLRIIYKRMV